MLSWTYAVLSAVAILLAISFFDEEAIGLALILVCIAAVLAYQARKRYENENLAGKGAGAVR